MNTSKNKKFSIENINGIDTLQINGAPAACPYRNPFFMPPTIQGAPPQLSIPACNNFCPFFNFDGENLNLKCTNTQIITTK